jgi:hypothetical protein
LNKQRGSESERASGFLEICKSEIIFVSQFLATDPVALVRFPALPEKKSSGSGTGSTQPREYN